MPSFSSSDVANSKYAINQVGTKTIEYDPEIITIEIGGAQPDQTF